LDERWGDEGSWQILHKAKLHNFYYLIIRIVSMIKELNMGLADKGSRVGLLMNWWENLKVFVPLGHLGMDGKIILTMDLKITVHEGVNWRHLT